MSTTEEKKDSFSFENDPGNLPEDQDQDFSFTDIPVLGGSNDEDPFSFEDIPETDGDFSAASSLEKTLPPIIVKSKNEKKEEDASEMDATASVTNIKKTAKPHDTKSRKKRIAITAAILVVIAIAVPVIISERAKATAAAEAKQKQIAAEKERKAKEEKKKKIAAMQKSASSKLKEGDAEKALEQFNKIISMDKTISSAYTGIGKCYEKMKDIEKAKENYRQAIDNAPKSPAPYIALATILIKEKKIDEAKNILETGKKKFNTAPALLLAIGDLYYAAGKYEKAIEAYNSVKDQTFFAEDTIKRYSSLLSKKSKDKAKDLLIFAGEKFKNASFFLSAEKLAGSPTERVEILEKALTVLPKDNSSISELNFFLTEAKIQNGDKAAASQTIHSIDLSKLDKKYYTRLIYLALKAEMADLKDYCLKLIASHPNDVQLQEAILKELQKEQSPEDLLSIYSAWLQDNSNNPAANYLYALALGNSLSAEKYLKHAIALKPDFYEVLIGLAKIEINKNQLTPAKLKLTKAVKLKKDKKEPHKLLAIIQIRQGKEAQAIKEYETFLDSIKVDEAEKTVELLDLALKMKTPQQAEKYLIKLKSIPSMHQKWREYNAAKKLIFGGATPADFAGEKAGKLRQYYILYILSKGQYTTLINLRTSKEEFPEFWKVYVMRKKRITTWRNLAELYLKKNIKTGDLAKLLITSMWLKKKTPEEVEKQIPRLPLDKKGITYAMIAEEYVKERKSTKAIIRFKKAMNIPRNIYSDVVTQIYNSLRHSKQK